MSGLKAIKINVLSLVAFPLLLLATVVKLFAKAMEKTITILGSVLILGGITLILEFLKSPGDMLNGIVMIIILLLIGGIFTVVVIGVLAIVSAAIMGVVALIIGVLNSLYEFIYLRYAGIYRVCYEDYCMLEMDTGVKRAGCFVFTLLRIVNRMIVFFATHAVKVLSVLCVLMIGYSVIKTNNLIQSVFGIDLITYLKLFPMFEIISGCVLYLSVAIGVVIVVLSLGVEWSEWGAEMSVNTSDYEKYMKRIKSEFSSLKKERISENTETDPKRLEKCYRYLDIINYHIRSADEYMRDIMPVAEKSNDHILRANSGQYITDFYDIVKKINKFGKKLPVEELEKLMPQIDRIEELRKKVEQQVQKLKEKKERKIAAGFFGGCDTAEKLEKRYRALCKTYHPDSEAGDEETFKRMQDEYEERKVAFKR